MADKWKIGIFVFITLTIVMAENGIAGKQVKLTVGVVLSPVTAAPWIAENKNFFRDEGLNVNIKEFDSGMAAFKMMLEKDGPDIILPANLPVVFNSFASDDYAIFAGFVKNDNHNKLIAREDKGIKVPIDLKGKKIGVTKGTSGNYFLGIFLNANKLKISDVEVVYLDAKSLPKALIEGQVDAISTWEPHIENAKKIMGVDARVFSSKGILNEYFYFVAKKDFIKNNQDALVKFLKAIEKGNKFLRNHPLESIDIVSEKSKIDKMTLISQWNDYEFGLYLDQAIMTSLKEQADWAIENRLVNAAKAPDYRGYIYIEILNKVKPESVTIER